MLYIPLLFTLASFLKSPSAPDTNGLTINKHLLLQLVNDTRKKGCNCGDAWYGPAPALSWNNKLEAAAAEHATEMNGQRYFSHTGNDGSNAGQRMERQGYNWMIFGENIAQGYVNEQDAIRGWIGSPGHCKNIMNRSFTEMGVARSGTYWTQVFGSKK